VLGIDEDARRPQVFGDLLSGDELAIFRHQQQEQLHRHPFDLHGPAGAEEFKTLAIQLKLAELKDAQGHRCAPAAKV
jgi:hypothetical protein